MVRNRAARASLRHMVSLVWTQDEASTAARAAPELMLPTGATHIVIGSGSGGPIVGLIGGARDAPYRKNGRCFTGWSLGAMLRPQAALSLLDAPGYAFAGRHTILADVWSATDWLVLTERLGSEASAERRLAVFEEELERRLTGANLTHRLTARALAGLDAGASVRDVVAQIGCSHRHLAARFTEMVGLKPKTYQRLRRFNRALDRLWRDPATTLADIAAEAGYADQAHFTRDFVGFAGLTPGAYRRISPVQPRHVPLSG